VGGGRCPSRSGWEITLSCVINGSVSAIPAVSSRQVEFPARTHTHTRAHTHTEPLWRCVLCFFAARKPAAAPSTNVVPVQQLNATRPAASFTLLVPSPRPLQPPGVPLPNIRRCRQPAYRFHVFQFAGPASRAQALSSFVVNRIRMALSAPLGGEGLEGGEGRDDRSREKAARVASLFRRLSGTRSATAARGRSRRRGGRRRRRRRRRRREGGGRERLTT